MSSRKITRPQSTLLQKSTKSLAVNGWGCASYLAIIGSILSENSGLFNQGYHLIKLLTVWGLSSCQDSAEDVVLSLAGVFTLNLCNLGELQDCNSMTIEKLVFFSSLYGKLDDDTQYIFGNLSWHKNKTGVFSSVQFSL